MALGIPKPVTKIYKTLDLSEGNKRRIGTIYYFYLKYYLKTTHKIKYRNHLAPINPFQIVYVDPKNIKNRFKDRSVKKEHWLKSSIIDGEWDIESIESFDQKPAYKGAIERFEQGVEWEETTYYRYIENKYNCGKAEEVTAKMENLFNSINEIGYKEQTALESYDKPIIGRSEYINHLLRELNEVKICIGRDGELLHGDGQHRLTIAKILDIEKIPVQIMIRHQKWQEKRNEAIENPEKLTKQERNHPDIIDLI